MRPGAQPVRTAREPAGGRLGRRVADGDRDCGLERFGVSSERPPDHTGKVDDGDLQDHHEPEELPAPVHRGSVGNCDQPGLRAVIEISNIQATRRFSVPSPNLALPFLQPMYAAVQAGGPSVSNRSEQRHSLIAAR